jgi:hypothetical protein
LSANAGPAANAAANRPKAAKRRIVAFMSRFESAALSSRGL